MKKKFTEEQIAFVLKQVFTLSNFLPRRDLISELGRLGTDSGLCLALGSIALSFLQSYYNLKPSLLLSLHLPTFL